MGEIETSNLALNENVHQTLQQGINPYGFVLRHPEGSERLLTRTSFIDNWNRRDKNIAVTVTLLVTQLLWIFLTVSCRVASSSVRFREPTRKSSSSSQGRQSGSGHSHTDPSWGMMMAQDSFLFLSWKEVPQMQITFTLHFEAWGDKMEARPSMEQWSQEPGLPHSLTQAFCHCTWHISGKQDCSTLCTMWLSTHSIIHLFLPCFVYEVEPNSSTQQRERHKSPCKGRY